MRLKPAAKSLPGSTGANLGEICVDNAVIVTRASADGVTLDSRVVESGADSVAVLSAVRTITALVAAPVASRVATLAIVAVTTVGGAVSEAGLVATSVIDAVLVWTGI